MDNLFASWHFWIGVSCCFRKAVYEITFRTPSLKAHLLELFFAGGDLWADPRLSFLSFLEPTLSLRPPGTDLCHRPWSLCAPSCATKWTTERHSESWWAQEGSARPALLLQSELHLHVQLPSRFWISLCRDAARGCILGNREVVMQGGDRRPWDSMVGWLAGHRELLVLTDSC